jgi:hypothetical protein
MATLIGAAQEIELSDAELGILHIDAATRGHRDLAAKLMRAVGGIVDTR